MIIERERERERERESLGAFQTKKMLALRLGKMDTTH